MCPPSGSAPGESAAQQLEHFLEFQPQLAHDLLTLAHVGARLFTGELVACPTDGEALLIQQAANLADDDHILPLVVATVATTLDGLELRKFLFPITQDVRLYATQITDFTDGEVTLAGNRRKRVAI